MKLSIVSVVGAFRTGKSFLLDFFLKYLRYPQNKMGEEAWNNLFTSKTKLDGNSNLNENNNNIMTVISLSYDSLPTKKAIFLYIISYIHTT